MPKFNVQGNITIGLLVNEEIEAETPEAAAFIWESLGVRNMSKEQLIALVQKALCGNESSRGTEVIFAEGQDECVQFNDIQVWRWQTGREPVPASILDRVEMKDQWYDVAWEAPEPE